MDKPFQPQVHYFVGGATKLYGAALYRLRAQDFGELRHHDGISPAWPIAYEEMEPYYTQAEQLYRVRGARGEDPTEPPASAPYPFPAVSHEPRIQQLADDLRAARAPSLPRALRGDARRGRHALQHVRALPRLRRLPVPGPRQVRCRGDRRATGDRARQRDAAHERDAPCSCAPTMPARPSRRSLVERDGAARELTAPTSSSSSCGAANSAKLLLALGQRSRTRTAWPTAPTRSGATTCSTTASAVLALSKEPNPTVFQKTLGRQRLLLREPTGSSYPIGNIQMVGKSQAPMYRGEKPLETKLAPNCSLEDIATHAVDFWLSTEDLPDAREPGHADRRRRGEAHLHGDE